MNAILPSSLATAALLLFATVAPAVAQAPGATAPTPPPAFDPRPIMPIGQPLTLSVTHVPGFRFAVELTNIGTPLPGGPIFALIEGGGTVARGPGTTTWQIAIERMFLDGMQLAGPAPMMAMTINVDNARPSQRIYTTDYRGLDSVAQTAPGQPARSLMPIMAHTAAHLLFMPLPQPVSERVPVVDFGETFQAYLAKMVPSAQIVRAPAPAFAVGRVIHRGRAGVLARQDDQFAARMFYRDVALRTEATGVIDMETGLPLFVRARAYGPVDLPTMRGPLDFFARLAVSIGDMGNPVAALAPPPPPEPLPGGAVAVPRDSMPPGAPQTRPAAPAPAAAPAAKPPAPAAKPPAATPAAPAAPPPATAPSRPGGSDDVARRLEQLKSLFDRGLITKEQYETKQKEILGNL